MQPVVLSNSIWTLSLLPAWGGRIAALRAGRLDLLVPIDSAGFDPLNWPRAGAYPLMPYSNRLRDAKLDFNGRNHRLPAHPSAMPHTLHGVSHTQAWKVVSADAEHVLIACDYQGEHWPWAFRAEQHFALQGDRLRITLTLTNHADHPMPGGLGLHPYFQRHPGMCAQYNVGRDWVIDSDYLATGEHQDQLHTLTLEADDSSAMAHYQSRWDGHLCVEYANGRLDLRASAAFSHFVAFAPADAAYLCLEPVSHLADAFNRPRSMWTDVGTHELAPGQSLTATLDFVWQDT
ncbi:aldose 1-epimerase [Pseudomonas sp. Pseusp11]|uniref:aldose 1-epimerase n=1 Tax=Pseudomonas sp. Pseusp11 TaxID=3243003 RepID=UPI0039B66C67